MSYHWGSANKELMLDNTTRFKQTWHKSEISTTIDKRSIIKELIWLGPETVWIQEAQVCHLVCAFSRIWLVSVGRPCNKELDPVIILLYDLFSNLKDQVNTLLYGNSSHK